MSIPASQSFIWNKDAMLHMSNIERKRRQQKIRLVKYLFDTGSSTINGIFTALGISAPTCQTLIGELITENMVERMGKAVSIGGRKPDLYALKDGIYYVLSIDMERFRTKVALYDNNNNNISGIRVLSAPISKDLSIISQLHDFVVRMLDDMPAYRERLIGIGISMPGLVEVNKGRNYTYLNMEEESLQQGLQEKFGIPVFIHNDVKSAAIAERRYGAAREKKDALILLMDWGIGLGIIMDGELRSGSKGFSGEIGHMPFVDDGALCYCGKRGCLETVASGIALANMAKEGIKSGNYSLLNELSDQEIDKIEPHVIIETANRGDQYAINILSKVGTSLGKGIATLIQLFNPEIIILGGKMAEAKQYISIPIIHAVNTYSMMQMREGTQIVLSELKQDAALMGSVAIVIDHVLSKQIDEINF